MGCGKSKHDVVTGNTSGIRKPSEVESVKGKESETMKRQGSCRCRKTNDDISAVVSTNPPETTVENITKKPEEKIEIQSEEKETTISPSVTVILPENVVTEEKETTTSSPVKAIVPENVLTEETFNNVTESVLPEQKEKIDDSETLVEEEPELDVQTPATMELEVEETFNTDKDDQTPEDEVVALEQKPVDITN